MVGATARPRGRPRKSQAVAPAATAPINSFARVSKQAIAITTTEKDVPSSSSLHKKRKAAPSPEPEEMISITNTTTTATTTTVVTSSSRTQSQNKKVRLQAPESVPTTTTLPILDEVPATPRSRRTQKRALSPSIEESPRTREAGNLFKRLRINHSPTRRSSPLAAASTATSSTRTSTPSSRSLSPEHDTASNQAAESSNATTPEPAEQEVETTVLPQELLDVISLYASLLKTLTLHYAHNGTNAPVDLRQISQAVSIAWGKRRISLADVRRCVGIMDTSASASPFYLVDYGNKKVCIELRESFQGKPLDEDHLVGVFERNLRKIWNGVLGNTAAQDLGALILSLPKATVQSCDSVAKASPLLSRGQKAMAELKQGIAARKEEKEATKAAIVSNSTSSNSNSATPSGLKPSLLERLRLKEAQLAQLAVTGPTPAELERKAALQRADDVAAVISMLAKSVPAAGMGGRVSFTMVMLLQKLKDSLRLPISQEEGAACVRLLAAEVAPEWLKIVKIGGKENVVITTGRALSSNVVNERVRMLCV